MEYDWSAPPLPDRYALREGTWPSALDQAVVSPRAGYRIGDSVAAFGGREILRVVGIAEDRSNQNGVIVFGFPSQWRSWSIPDAASLYPNSAANVEVFWSGAPRATAVSTLSQAIGSSPLSIDQSIQDRAQLANAHRDIPSVLLPITGLAPLLLVPVVVGLAVGAIFGSWNSRARSQLFMLGIPGHMSNRAIGLASAASVAIGWTVACIVGSLLGIGVRPILDLLLPYELAPWRPAWLYGIEALSLGLLGALLGITASPALARGLALLGRLTRLRRPAAGFCLLGLIVAVPASRNGAGMSVVAVLAALAVAPAHLNCFPGGRRGHERSTLPAYLPSAFL